MLKNLSLNVVLTINASKSKIFFNKGCTDKAELKEITGFPESHFPTKYLGTPLSPI